MSLDSVLHREIEKNKELKEKLLLIGFALQRAKVSVDELEEGLRQWPEGKQPDVLIALFSYANDVRIELNNVSKVAGNDNTELVAFQVIPQGQLEQCAI